MKSGSVSGKSGLHGLFDRFLAQVRRVESWAVLSCVSAVVVSVIWGVLTRHISQRPAAWTGEVASIAFCWVGFIGAAYIYGGDSHPRIFDPKTISNLLQRRVLKLLGLTMEIVVLILVGLLAIKQIGINMTNPTAVLRLPGSIYYVPIVWFSASSLLNLIHRR